MEISQGHTSISSPKFEPDTSRIKEKLLRKGVYPTPKIIHTLRKKEIQKHNRKLKDLTDQSPGMSPSLSEDQKQALAEDTHFQTLKNEYKEFSKAMKAKPGVQNGAMLVGRPWERLETVGLKELTSGSTEYKGEKLKKENLRELREMFEARKLEDLSWVLDDDIELKEEWLIGEKQSWDPLKRRRGEGEVIRFLVDRLSSREISMKDWKFSRMMKLSGLQFTEGQLLKILDGLGAKGSWKQAMSVVEWVYNRKSHIHYKSRFVYTKLLAVLGMACRPQEALRIFNLMRGDGHIYPDMAAYHSIAVTLGQAGLLKDLLKIIECVREQPSKRIKYAFRKNWDPTLEPDIVVYNAILNACVPSLQWKGVYWVFKQLRKSGLKPNGPTYGLAMEVMLKSGKYDHVHELFRKMKKSGEALKATTYKVLVRTYWEEGKVNEAVEAVRDMEQRGVVGNVSVYYELSCCLCNNGRWQDALVEAKKIKKLPHTKPLAVTFTGMILSSLDGGHIDDCISIFEHMKGHCAPNIGILNAMLKVYGRNDMFSKAKEIFEEIKKADSSFHKEDGVGCIIPDEYTYNSMLEAAARSLQWEYFEFVYREMALSGFQVDQNKHAKLLVEASRAGKWYLLEHAFDIILDAGEIPQPLLFTEMVLQATVQHNFKRAVALVNSLGYAPFQISERQWTDLFETNKHRIDQDCLEKLLNALTHFNVSSEITVSNLTRSLHSLCRRSLGSHSFRFNGNERGDYSSAKTESIQVSHATTNPTVDFLASDEPTDFLSDKFSALNFNGDFEDDDEDDDDVAVEIPIGGFDDFHESNAPSAGEILKSWKESRKKDGKLFPFD